MSIVLMAIPGPPVMDAETAEQVRGLMAKGFAGTIFLTTDDCQACAGRAAARARRGVIAEEPEERPPYGIDSEACADPSGNHLRFDADHVEMAAVWTTPPGPTLRGRRRVRLTTGGAPKMARHQNAAGRTTTRRWSALPFRFAGLLSGRYAIASGTRVFELRWRRRSIDAIDARQLSEPVAMVRDGRRVLWYFHDRFYWEDDDLTGVDVAALVFQREERSAPPPGERPLAGCRAAPAGRRRAREKACADPRLELRRKAVAHERDGGACRQCGATFDLQYDPRAAGSRWAGRAPTRTCSCCAASATSSKGDSL